MSTYVIQYEKEAVHVVARCSEPKTFVPMQLTAETTTTDRTTTTTNLAMTCSSLLPGEPVKFPQRPSTGIVNPTVREAVLQEYAKNPLVFTIHWNNSDNVDEEKSCSRHFMGFGFSKEVPYFPPGTRIQFVHPSSASATVSTTTATTTTARTITGMVAAYGNRSHEFAVILSLDQPMHADAVALFLESYNTTEIDCGEEGFCKCLSTIISKYTYAVGDVDPSCTSSDIMENSIASKFQDELERMMECVQMAIFAVTNPAEDEDDDDYGDEDEAEANISRQDRRRWKAGCIERAFRTYRQTLLLQMRHQPLGTREWIQMFESYMSFAVADQGIGFINFVLH
jgi:hypothetical protein